MSAPARRDLLGLSALLGPGSELVPVSDIDGASLFGCPAPAAREVAPAAPADGHDLAVEHCSTCTTQCSADLLAQLRDSNRRTGRNP